MVSYIVVLNFSKVLTNLCDLYPKKNKTQFQFLQLLVQIQDDKSQYVNTLQPKYNSVDLTEVELPEMDSNNNGNNNNNNERGDENNNMLLDVCIHFITYLCHSRFFFVAYINIDY